MSISKSDLKIQRARMAYVALLRCEYLPKPELVKVDKINGFNR